MAMHKTDELYLDALPPFPHSDEEFYKMETTRDVPTSALWFERCGDHLDGRKLAIWPRERSAWNVVHNVFWMTFYPDGAVVGGYGTRIEGVDTPYNWRSHIEHLARRNGYKVTEPGRNRTIRVDWHPGDVVAVVFKYIERRETLDQSELNRLYDYRQFWNPRKVRKLSLWTWANYLLASEWAARALDSAKLGA